MSDKEKAQIREEIRNLQSLIDHANPGNPDIPRWRQQIENLKSRLNF